MSRVGNKLITMPAGVTATVENKTITVKGPKGELKYTFEPCISVEVKENTIVCTRSGEDKTNRSLHGTTRANIQNMVTGVSEGFKKILEIVGVGYRANLQGKVLVVSAGYSHPVNMPVPEGLTVVCPSQVEIHISGIDKQLVGEYAAEIRKIRGPEPYKGKGIHYQGEYIRRKEGKKAK